MSARLPGLGCALLLALLTGCGPTRNQFAPVCPGTAILGDAADLDLYRSSGQRGGGRDLTDLVVHARIASIQGNCRPGDGKNQLAVSVTVGVELTRGPAMPGRETSVPIFLAVVQNDTILDKHLYLMHSVFPSNVDRVTMTPGAVELALPITPAKSGASYSILAGFQLTPEQIEQSRRNNGG